MIVLARKMRVRIGDDFPEVSVLCALMVLSSRVYFTCPSSVVV